MGFKFHAVVLYKTILLILCGLAVLIVGFLHPAVFFGSLVFVLLYFIVWAITVEKWDNYD